MRFVFCVKDRGCEETEIARRAWDVEGTRKGEWFAGVDRFRACQFLQIALNQVGDPQEKSRPIGRRFFRPIWKSSLRRRGGKIDVATVAVCGLRIGLARGRLDVVEIFPADRLDKLAVDEVSNLD